MKIRFRFFYTSRTRFFPEEEDSTHEHRSAKKDRLVRSWNRILRWIDKTSDVNPFDGIFTSISLFLSLFDDRRHAGNACTPLPPGNWLDTGGKGRSLDPKESLESVPR